MFFDSRSNCLYQSAPAAAPSRGAVAAAGFAMTGHFCHSPLPRFRASVFQRPTFRRFLAFSHYVTRFTPFRRSRGAVRVRGPSSLVLHSPPAHWPRGQRPAFGHVIFVTACHVSYAFIFSARRLRRSTLSFMCGGVWCHCTPRSIGSLSCF